MRCIRISGYYDIYLAVTATKKVCICASAFVCRCACSCAFRGCRHVSAGMCLLVPVGFVEYWCHTLVDQRQHWACVVQPPAVRAHHEAHHVGIASRLYHEDYDTRMEVKSESKYGTDRPLV